jgi:hypothetical protein
VTTPLSPAIADALETVLAHTPPGSVAAYMVVDLAATEPPWMDTGLAVERGDTVTIIRDGRISLGDSPLWLPAGFNVWARIGGRGPLQRGTRPSHTFVAAHDGQLELGNCQPAEWSDPDGTITDDPGVYALMTGGSCILAIRWAPGTDVGACLQMLADQETAEHGASSFFGGEVERLATEPGRAPEGWEHLWYVGPSEVFTRTEDRLVCTSLGDAAIIWRDAAVDLTAESTLSWDWKMDALPSTQPEDAFETHDYLSLAVEFDDGQDLTYHWSAALEVETTYRCPLPHWSERETHLVVRSGPVGLGQWQHQSRQVLADHQRAIGGPPPARIIKVWLIALTCMQRREGRGEYRSISLRDGSTTVDVL